MARALNGTTQFLRRDAAIVTAPPCTLCAWVRPGAINRDQMILTLSWGNGGGRYDQLVILIFSNNKAGADTYLSTTLTRASSSGTVATNTWYFVCGTFSTTAGQYVWLNDVKSASGGNSQAPANMNRTTVGGLTATSDNLYLPWNGRVAEAAIYNDVLTDAEIIALSRGQLPISVRRENLSAYWPLGGRYGQSDVDRWKNKYDVTAYNAPTWEDHPRVIYPRIANLPQRAASVGGATPWLYARRRSQIIGAGGVH